MDDSLSRSNHFNDAGQAHTVDVSAKEVTVRRARAAGHIAMMRQTAERIRQGDARKGDVLGIARIAGISATKLTQQLIPLCHAIPIEAVSIDFHWIDRPPTSSPPASSSPASSPPAAPSERDILQCVVEVRTSAKTGVEMEAMTAVSIACLTVYDMVKSVDREMTIGPIELWEKSGGKSGQFCRTPQPEG